MSQGKKIAALLGLIVVALGALAFVLLRSGDGDANSNVADFAKSIDHTKSGSPSVPPERLQLGRSGARKGG